MSNEKTLKELTGVEFVMAMKRIMDFPYCEYVNWDVWLAAECSDPTFTNMEYPLSGDGGRWHSPDGKMYECAILDTRYSFGQQVAIGMLLHNGQIITCPVEDVDVAQVNG